MKRIIVITILILALATAFVNPVMADDPPVDTTDVDVTVVTPDNVNLLVGITAGGQVHVTVDGYDIDGMAAQLINYAIAINGLYQAGFITANDWWNFYHQEIEPSIAALLAADQETNSKLDLAFEALARLIQTDTVTGQQIDNVTGDLGRLASQMDTDNEAWNRLMNQILEEIAALNRRLADQEAAAITQSISQAAQVENLRGDLDIADANGAALEDRAEILLYALMGLGGVTVILAGVVIILFRNVRKIGR